MEASLKQAGIEAIHQFKKLTAIVVGDVMVDSYIWGTSKRISPEAPVPIVDVKKKENRLGGAANVALNIKSLGANPVMCTVIGADDMALVFSELLENEGLSDRGILNSSNRITTQKTRIISDHQHMVRIDDESSKDLENEDENRLIERAIELIHSVHPDVLIFEDYNKGVCTPKVIQSIIEACNQKGIPTAVDPKKANFFAYAHVTLFKPNLKEFTEGLKLDHEPQTTEDWIQSLVKLRDRIPHTHTLVTRSEDGILVDTHGQHIFIPAHVRSIADVSGAGDTVISVASLCLALKCSPKEIAYLSNLAGGLVCEMVGVVPISSKMLIEELSHN
jgi:rfaE bifunctional protein kinase chain/domain